MVIADAHTRSGPVRGTDNGQVKVWKGIRYGAPPVGDLRWRAPVAPEPWTEIADATAFGPVCPQPKSPIPLGPGTRVDEDCLFLNVWAPSGAAGGARSRSWCGCTAAPTSSVPGSQPLYDGRTLASRGDVVVVTLNYRMGALRLPGTRRSRIDGDQRFDTNLGMRDVLLALHWVQDNIARVRRRPGAGHAVR